MTISQIYAKPDQTLADHSLHVVDMLIQWRENIPDMLDDSVWQQLMLAGLLHDLGKTARGFQRSMLQQEVDHIWRREHHRHEILSLVWVGRLLHRSPHFYEIAASVATHHKSWHQIQEKYGGTYADDEQTRARRILLDQLDEQNDIEISIWLHQILDQWLIQYDWIRPMWLWENRNPSDALDLTLKHIAQNQRQSQPAESIHIAHLMRGLLLYCDHCASAGIRHLLPLDIVPEYVLRHLPSHLLYSHQRAMNGQTNVMLIAPTGLGKTEAALIWAGQRQAQRISGRLFYILPYQTSMNAMAQRLSQQLYDVPYTNTTRPNVSLLHSRIAQHHHQWAIKQGMSPKQANRYALHQRNLARLNIAPIQVCSPYQLLKAIFGVRGHTITWATLYRARLIIDEIHSYEPTRTGMILALIHYLSKHYHTETLIMSATLPHPLRQKIQNLLPDVAVIRPHIRDYQKVRRHRLHLLTDDLTHQVEHIITHVKDGQRVLVICNLVRRAQDIYSQLRQKLDSGHVLLLHGRFNGKDRQQIEDILMTKAGVGVESMNGFVLVATQTVEVSLDVDFDRLYSDPAPLEALLQRFGRVNRGRTEQVICPVYICGQPETDEDALPYNMKDVVDSLVILRQHNGEIIHEEQLDSWLDTLYDTDRVANWQAKFDIGYQQTHDLLRQLLPFTDSPPSVTSQFYRLFDGRDVLPIDCVDVYYDALEQGDFMGAQLYAVSISWKQYHMLKGSGWVVDDPDYDMPQVHVPYTSEEGLILDWEQLL